MQFLGRDKHEGSMVRALATPGRPGRQFRPGFDVVKHPLPLLLMAATIPVLLFAAYRSADGERTAAREAARNTIERVADRITAEMSAEVQVAETLTLSGALDGPDLAAFYGEAERLKEARPLWHTIELTGPSGTQIMNLLAAQQQGDRRPAGDQREDR